MSRILSRTLNRTVVTTAVQEAHLRIVIIHVPVLVMAHVKTNAQGQLPVVAEILVGRVAHPRVRIIVKTVLQAVAEVQIPVVATIVRTHVVKDVIVPQLPTIHVTDVARHVIGDVLRIV